MAEATATATTTDTTTTTPAADTQAAGDRPAWLPQQFETPEAFAKAYTELRTKMDSTPAPKTETTPAPKADTPAITAEAAQAAGIDMNALAQEYARNGELSTETLDNLTAKGFDKATVDGYIAGQQAIAGQIQSKLEGIAGGKEKLEATLKWAAANLTQQQQDAYNAALDSGNIDLAQLTLQGILTQYDTANGTDPQLITGGEAVATAGVKPFESAAAVSAAMRDPKYATDEAYRQDVYKRLQVTSAMPVVVGKM